MPLWGTLLFGHSSLQILWTAGFGGYLHIDLGSIIHFLRSFHIIWRLFYWSALLEDLMRIDVGIPCAIYSTMHGETLIVTCMCGINHSFFMYC